MALSPNMRAALFMCISMAGFTMNDAITKVASAWMNMGQVMLVRGVFASVLIAAIAWHQGALARPAQVLHPKILLRAACEAAATVTFLIALSHLPIANVSAILQALPLAVTMGAAQLFSEPVGWRRWLAIFAGLTGVLIIVRPGGDGFSPYAIVMLVCVFFCASRDLITRLMPLEIPTLLVSTTTALSVTICGAFLVGPMGGWTAMTLRETALMAIGAMLLLVGYQFIIRAMRAGDISFVAPFRYTALLWSLILGFVVFGDIPDLPMIVGATIVVASGLYTLYRERKVGRHRVAAESTQPGMAPDGI
ncbi:MAG: DMT family transporter [Rhizobiaceae bacterium]|nr:DMT family transporter [Rhizobiaceae bacterium]